MRRAKTRVNNRISLKKSGLIKISRSECNATFWGFPGLFYLYNRSCNVYLKVGMCPGEQTDTSNLPQTRFWMKTFVYLSLPYVIFRCSCSNVDTAVQLHTKLQRIGDEESFKAPQNYADCRAIYYHICALF